LTPTAAAPALTRKSPAAPAAVTAGAGTICLRDKQASTTSLIVNNGSYGSGGYSSAMLGQGMVDELIVRPGGRLSLQLTNAASLNRLTLTNGELSLNGHLTVLGDAQLLGQSLLTHFLFQFLRKLFWDKELDGFFISFVAIHCCFSFLT
jgi:hypothetical protein